MNELFVIALQCAEIINVHTTKKRRCLHRLFPFIFKIPKLFEHQTPTALSIHPTLLYSTATLVFN